MSTVLAFDVYGTLIDTHGLLTELQDLVGAKATAFSHTWRDKQLEYSFRRGLMQNYQTFAVCTRQALDYTCAFHQANLSDEQKNNLFASYRALPAFSDVEQALHQLKDSGFRLYAFSNGAFDALESLLGAAGIREMFLDLISVDPIKSFKPNPAVYAHFLRQSQSNGSSTWMISSNPFDVIGAISAGMKAAWVRRSPEAIFDPWGIKPTITVERLTDLRDAIAQHSA